MIAPGWAGWPVLVLRALDESAAEIAAAGEVLDAEERAQADRFRRKEDRERFLLGRSLLRRLVGAATGRCPAGLRLFKTDNGKPALADAGTLAFNLSHSGNLVLVAIARARALGVDVEQHRPDVDLHGVGRAVFTERELADLLAAGPAAASARFFRQWVLKEALVKALGTGLARDPRRFQIIDGCGYAPEFVGEDRDDIGEGWQLEEIGVPAGYSAAMAILP